MLLAALPFGANWFDVVWLIAVVFGLWNGIRTGFLGEIVRFVGWVLMIWLSVKFYAPVGDWLKQLTGVEEEPCRLMAFVGIVIGVYLLSLLLRKFVSKWTRKTKTAAFLENCGGGFLGVLRMVLVMIFLTIWLSLTRSPFWHRHVSTNSQCSSLVVRQLPAVANVVQKQFPETFPFFRDLERASEVDADESDITSNTSAAKKSR